MRIELLYLPGCPNHAPAVQGLREVLAERGLPPEIAEIQAADPAQPAAREKPPNPTESESSRSLWSNW